MEIIVEALRISLADFSLVDLVFCSLSPELLHISSPAYDVSGADTQYISLTADI